MTANFAKACKRIRFLIGSRAVEDYHGHAVYVWHSTINHAVQERRKHLYPAPLAQGVQDWLDTKITAFLLTAPDGITFEVQHVEFVVHRVNPTDFEGVATYKIIADDDQTVPCIPQEKLFTLTPTVRGWLVDQKAIVEGAE